VKIQRLPHLSQPPRLQDEGPFIGNMSEVIWLFTACWHFSGVTWFVARSKVRVTQNPQTPESRRVLRSGKFLPFLNENGKVPRVRS
jgi:hypothetical protein